MWSNLLLKRQNAENVGLPETGKNVVGASCVDTGLTTAIAPWITDDTRGMTPMLPGQPIF